MVERSALAFGVEYARSKAGEVALLQHGVDFLCQVASLIWEVRLGEVSNSAL